jgi:prepilin-type N-terminal cleavage/methylation domain-containing protein
MAVLHPGGSLPCARRNGFTLLETVVALVLLSTLGLALFAWIQQATVDASRAQRLEQEARLTLNAHSLMLAIDPVSNPAGELQQHGLTLKWTSRLVEPARPALAPSIDGVGTPTNWRISLHEVRVEAEQSRPEAEAGQAPGTVRVGFTMLLVGQRNERPSQGAAAP